MYDIENTIITKIEKVFLNISHGCLDFKSEYYGLKKSKMQNILSLNSIK